MNDPIISTPSKPRPSQRRAGQGGVSWSNHVPTVTMCVAASAWVAAFLYQIATGIEWSRALALLGLLLPIGALAPFTALFRKQAATSLPFRDASPSAQVAGPRRHRTLHGAPLDSIPAVLPLWRLFDKIARTGRTDYPVVDESGHLVGMISLEDLPPYPAREALGWLVAADIMRAPKSAA